MRNVMASNIEAEVGRFPKIIKIPPQHELPYNKRDTRNHPPQWQQTTLQIISLWTVH